MLLVSTELFNCTHVLDTPAALKGGKCNWEFLVRVLRWLRHTLSLLFSMHGNFYWDRVSFNCRTLISCFSGGNFVRVRRPYHAGQSKFTKQKWLRGHLCVHQKPRLEWWVPTYFLTRIYAPAAVQTLRELSLRSAQLSIAPSNTPAIAADLIHQHIQRSCRFHFLVWSKKLSIWPSKSIGLVSDLNVSYVQHHCH